MGATHYLNADTVTGLLLGTNYSLIEWGGSTKPALLLCKLHGTYRINRGRDLIKSSVASCPKCIVEARVNKDWHTEKREEQAALRRTAKKEAFFTLANAKYARKFDYSVARYRGSQVPITIGCPTHGTFKQTPAEHLRNKFGCSGCAGNKPYTHEDFLLKARATHGTAYTYPERYVSQTTPLTIDCSLHGSFKQAPRDHIGGYRCPKCATKATAMARRMTQEEFVECCKVAHGGLYDYSKTVYTKLREPVVVTCVEHGDFTANSYHHRIGGAPCPYCNRNNSTEQRKLAKWLSKHTEVEQGRKFDGVEIDIYLPEYKIGIEVDGVYWHTEAKGKDVDYHLGKTLLLKKLGIRLFHFWDYEVNTKGSILRSMLRATLGLNTKIGARKCEVRRVTDSAEARSFLDKHHLQGYVPAALTIGLYSGQELIQLVSFGKSRFNKTHEWELLRFATKAGISVAGGFTRLIKHSGLSSFMTYSDLRFSLGAVYKANGFKFSHRSTPSYKYAKGGYLIISRYAAQKHKLHTLLGDSYNPSLTEKENMRLAGYSRLWDCGNLVWTWTGN